ncbi:chromosome-associated kinesin KIF4A [Anopheles nili]|uniref:chromosome-associated kinesin KIF4A n=1 Tax=Anopheles nili TaxID=185578 RepID=UPI00237C0A83|nr:chromosome-associated kinesin KIF4A [Anopheles nili]
MSSSESVKVAVRIRPMSKTERDRGCQSVVEQPVPNQPQIVICSGSSTADMFSFNNVFPPSTTQAHLYKKSVSELLDKLFEGYNVTILAYGQTSSGKTYTMGTDFTGELSETMGVIPRAIKDIFRTIANGASDANSASDITATCSFIELYQDNVFDLLAEKCGSERQALDIRETVTGNIILQGLTEMPIATAEDTFDCLVRGSTGRIVRATAMNNVSSRSHAIFTINILRSVQGEPNSTIRSKFHLVDLAGSERSKKTGTTGDRFKEGVEINKCLLALGNVITALGNASGTSANKVHVPYRSSKLTRLLQDSLGGNSYTLMIACVSPSAYNLSETHSTLRYAYRVCKIRNKPIINLDPQQALVKQLQETIQDLRLEILSLKSGHGSSETEDGFRVPAPPARSPARGLTDINLRPQRNTSDADKLTILRLQDANRLLQSQLQSTLHDLATNEMRATTAEKLLDDIEQTLAQWAPNQPKATCQEEKMDEDSEPQDERKAPNIREEMLCLLTAYKEELAALGMVPGMGGSGTSSSSTRSSLQSEEIEKKSESHTQLQMRIHNELSQLNRELALKEELHRKCMGNSAAVLSITTDRERDLSEKLHEYESMIHGLEQQLVELNSLLENTKSSEKRSKLSEERRRKVVQLESELTELRQKSLRQAKLLKLKERDSQRIEGLSAEIQTMKATRVKLLKTMRTESENFRQWRLNREKEICQLKAKDRKREYQMQKLESTYSQQKRIMQRKMDETIMVNRRLKATLDRRQRQISTSASDRSLLRGTQASQWIDHELELVYNTSEANITLNMLLKQRSQQATKLTELQAQLAECTDGTPEAGELEEEIHQIESDLAYRNAQIADLQQKIHTMDTDNQLLALSEGLAKLPEAREAFRRLLERATQTHTKLVEARFRLVEQQATNECQEETLAQVRAEYELAEHRYKEQVTQLEQTYEDKLALLLMERAGTSQEGGNGDARPDTVHEEAIRQIEKLRHDIGQYEANYGRALKRLNEVTEQPVHRQRKVPRRLIEESNTEEQPEDEWLSDAEEFDEVMELQRDPDFRATPLHKRKKVDAAFEGNVTNASVVSGRTSTYGNTSNGNASCSCSGNCKTKRCGCQKHGEMCKPSCKCAVGCLNRSQNNLPAVGETEQAETEEMPDSTTSLETPQEVNKENARRYDDEMDILTYCAKYRKRKPLLDI